MTKQTNAAFYTACGALTNFRSPPRPARGGEGEGLLCVKAAGLNPIDSVVREGNFQQALPSVFPSVSGIVEQVGPGVSRLAVGEEVSGMVFRPVVQHGTFAEHVVVPECYLPGALKS